MNDKVTLSIDGREVEAERGSYVLGVARRLGIEIPTLCEHPDLEPSAACRLCMVEVTHPDWNGWSGLMTACIYPVSEGIQVSTRSERVQRARRGVLTLLAARCPGSDAIRSLARRHGVEESHLAPLRSGSSHPSAHPHEADDCILCGLCTRVCETYATAAISTLGRGANKDVGPFAHAAPEECVGCGACALICPTHCIAHSRAPGSYTIWDRTIEVPVASVAEDRCLGCGACEEACPFSVARVTLRIGGQRLALIPAEHCRGCGACVGACPSGAIEHGGRYAWSGLSSTIRRTAAGSKTIFSCARANLSQAVVPDDVRVTELPCAGRISLPLLLSTFAGRSDGVLVLGRHQQTCRFGGAEDPARQRVERGRRVLELLGLGAERLQFVEPAGGADGPVEAVARFRAVIERLGPSPLSTAAPDALLEAGEGLETSLAIGRWLAQQDGTRVDGGPWLRSAGLPEAAPDTPALSCPLDLPLLAILDERLLRPTSLADQLAAALAALARLGFPGAGIVLGELRGELRGERTFTLSAVDALLRERGAGLPRPAAPSRVACDAARPGQRDLLLALGHEPIDVGPDPLPERFALTPDLRAEAERRLTRAEAQGAAAVLVDDIGALVRWSLVTREGTWRSSRIRPVLGAGLAQLTLAGLAPQPAEEVRP